MENLLLYANHYYNFGFNVTNITPIRKPFHLDDTVLKAPSHSWKQYLTERQKLSTLQSYDWKNACGIGVILGYDNLRAFDIDGINNFSLVRDFLKLLKLPEDYDWVVKSGSNSGIHIIFYAEEHNYPTKKGTVKAYKPNEKHSAEFKHVELRWIGHLVLPPSVHVSYNRYKFFKDNMPNSKPNTVKISDIENCIDFFCRRKENLIDKSKNGVDDKKEDSTSNISKMYIDIEDEEIIHLQKDKLYLETDVYGEKEEETAELMSKLYLDTDDDEQE